MKISLFGAGSYGLALAKMLSKKKNNRIYIWTNEDSKAKEFNNNHKIKELFPDIEFPSNVYMSTSYEEVLENTNMIFLVTTSKYIKDVTTNIKPYYKNIPICIAAKGIDHESLSPLSTLVKEILKTNNIAVISGPTFAIDLIHDEPCALAIAAYNNKTLNIIKESLQNDTLKLRKSSDIIGIQLCGSVKNIIAIAAGILKGLGSSESTQTFLINESLHDIKKIISSLGGKKKTILSFAGVGDLLLTCSSEKSRNYSFGYVIGSTKSKKKTDEYLKNNTVEGLYTLKSIYKMLQKKGIDIPLINIIYDIVINNKNPESIKEFLITKE